MSKKQILFFIFLSLIVLFFIILSIMLVFAPQSSPGTLGTPPEISLIPSQASSQTNQQTRPAVPYSQIQTDKLLQRVTTRTPLSDADKQVKQAVIAGMNPNSESVFATPQFRIEYIKSPDVFMVEILDTDINASKKAAIDWFLQKGI